MRPTEPFRQEHEELLEHIEHLARAARDIPRLSEEERAALRERVLGFLRGTLLPHAKAEEEILYPEWSNLVGYADALCAFIPGHVLSTVEETGLGLRIEFDEGAICLHPTVDEVPGPEIALLNGFKDGHWMCWRPGEESFEDLV